MHHEKLIKAMHEKAWTREEIKKGTAILKKIKEKKKKSPDLFNYWSNIFYLFVIIVVTSASLTPIISLLNKPMSFILTIIIGLIFGILASHSIISLEDYNYKHHRIWGNIILFIALLGVSYIVLELVVTIFNIGVFAFAYALTYKLSFAFFPAIIIVKHEKEINKNLHKIKRKIKKKKKI